MEEQVTLIIFRFNRRRAYVTFVPSELITAANVTKVVIAMVRVVGDTLLGLDGLKSKHPYLYEKRT